MNYRYEDVGGRDSGRTQPEWVKRGWRRRSELEPGQRLMRVELEIERLNTELGALKAAVLYASCHVRPDAGALYEERAEVALSELYALVPGAAESKDGGS